MNACIYARTARDDKSHDRTTVDNQIAFSRELARRHNLTVEPEHVFTDIDHEGHTLPISWEWSTEEGRPALGAMVDAIEAGKVEVVIVRRLSRLGSSSGVLTALAELFERRGVHVVVAPEQVSSEQDSTEQFAISSLRKYIRGDTEWERELHAAERARKLEEINRLKSRINRLEAELAEMSVFNGAS